MKNADPHLVDIHAKNGMSGTGTLCKRISPSLLVALSEHCIVAICCHMDCSDLSLVIFVIKFDNEAFAKFSERELANCCLGFFAIAFNGTERLMGFENDAIN